VKGIKPIKRLVAAVLVSGLLTGTAGAQSRVVATNEPVSLTVALAGVMVVGAGIGIMLHGAEYCCESRPGWIVGGGVVVGAGVTMTWLGLRSRTVVIAPVITPHVRGALGTIRWGAAPRVVGPRRR